MSLTKLSLAKTAEEQREFLNFANRLPPADATFLLQLFDFLLYTPGHQCDRDAFAEQLKKKERPNSQPIISTRLRNLIDKDLVTFAKQREDGVLINHYCLTSLSPLENLPEREKKSRAPRRTREQIKRQESLLAEDDALNFLTMRPERMNVYVHDRVFMGILDAGMRLSAKDNRHLINTTLKVGRGNLHIKTYCTSEEDSEISTLSDLRCARSLISWAKIVVRDKVEQFRVNKSQEPQPEDIDNLYCISVYDLAKFMGYSTARANLKAIRGMLKRLRQTEYEVDASENKWFQEVISMTGRSDSLYFRFLNNVEIVKEYEEVADLFGDNIDIGSLEPRWYTFSFEPRTHLSIVNDVLYGDGSLFLSHKELAHEQSGIIQRFYSWARSYIGGTDKPGLINRWFTLAELHQELVPASRYDNFCRYFIRAVQKFSKNSQPDWDHAKENQATIYGYIVTMQRESMNGGYLVNIKRDRTDPIVGDNSFHQQRLRQESMALGADS